MGARVNVPDCRFLGGSTRTQEARCIWRCEGVENKAVYSKDTVTNSLVSASRATEPMGLRLPRALTRQSCWYEFGR